MATVSGVITDSNGSAVSRTVRMYRRDTGAFLVEGFSSHADGTYTLTDAYTGEVQIVMLDDAAGTIENDQILRTIPV